METIDQLIKQIEAPQVPNRQGLDAYSLAELMEKYGVPGVGIAVIYDFKIHWTKSYGVADVETGAKVNEKTLFQAASISKPVAAMAVLKAVQDGLFSLDDDINTILKSWQLPKGDAQNGQPVTPRMLTSHTAGLGDGFGFPGYHPDEPIPSIPQILDGDELSNVGEVRLVRSPLLAFQYSGGGVMIMQQALMDAVGKPFEEIVQTAVFDPIGMTNSTFTQPLPPKWDQNATRAHDGNGKAMDAKWHVYPEQAAAGLWTTPTDLAKFGIEVQKSLRGEDNHVLTQSTVHEMLSPVGVGDFGIGFALRKEGQGWYFFHSGGNWGFKCLLWAHKAKGYGFAVMTNGSQGDVIMRELDARIARAYHYDSLDKPVVG
ncbi:MAG: serine hydrolase domain-containing protein [Chloroflexota bacterium]